MMSLLKEWIQSAFGNPRMLWLLAATLPVLSAFLWWAWRKRQNLIAQFVQSRLLAHLTVGISKTIQKTRLVLLVAAVGLLLLTLARPRWGFSWEEAKQQGLDIVAAIDTSRSMLAEDISPNRLARAKLAALDLMRLAKSDRLGLIAFAGTAFLQCPLTLDDEAFRQSVESLQVGIIPQGGTALTEAIETAAKAFSHEGDNHKVLILLTDGEDNDNESGALEAAKQGAEKGLRIFTIGVGTPNGELLPQRDGSGALSYIKNERGEVVKSRLDEKLLTQIATAANGFYLPMSGANTMQVLYDKGLALLPKTEFSSKLIKRYHERYQWFLALAIVLLLAEMFLPERKRVQRAETRPMPAPAAELGRAAAALLLVFLPFNAIASSAHALRKYQDGQFKEAEQEYKQLLEKRPDDPRLHYNAGAAAYQADDFVEATKHFSSALTSPDLEVQHRSYYNLGNSLYRLGEAQPDAAKKTQAWEQSVKQFEGALKLNPNDPDAKFNLEFVRKKLEELKQQQKQSQQQQNQGDPKDDQKNKDDSQKDQQEQKSKDSQSKPDSNKPEEKPKPQEQPKQNPPEQKDNEQGPSQNQKEKDEKDASTQPNKNNAAGADKSDDKSAQSAKGATAIGQMTPEQVKRLLDAAKNEEKAMIFIPKETKEKRTSKDRILKDW